MKLDLDELEKIVFIAPITPATALALIARVRELEARKCSHGPYKMYGTTDCSECDTGRTEIYQLEPKCIGCRNQVLRGEK